MQEINAVNKTLIIEYSCGEELYLEKFNDNNIFLLKRYDSL